MAGLIRRVAARQLLPLRSGPENPKRSIQYCAKVLARPAPAVLAPAVYRQQRLDELPLGIRDVHSDIP